jgi:tetratricopeptide (TPR) repeat protein
VDAHHRECIEKCLDQRGGAELRKYIEHVLLDEPNNVEFLELAADWSHGACDAEAELRFRMRAFSAVPTFSSLRKLAAVLSSTARWEMAAEAWLHVARARPLDAHAFAEGAAALYELARYQLAANSWECACRIQPHNEDYANAHANALGRSQQQIPQGSSPKGRSQL